MDTHSKDQISESEQNLLNSEQNLLNLEQNLLNLEHIPEIIDGIDISDYPERMKQIARSKFLPKPKAIRKKVERIAGMLTPYNSDNETNLYRADLWESIILHTAFPNWSKVKTQYEYRKIDIRKSRANQAKERFEIQNELIRIAKSCESKDSIKSWRFEVAKYNEIECKLQQIKIQSIERSLISNGKIQMYSGIEFKADQEQIEEFNY